MINIIGLSKCEVVEATFKKPGEKTEMGGKSLKMQKEERRTDGPHNLMSFLTTVSRRV